MDGHADVVTVLLGANAKVDLANGFGLTPLVFACRRGHTEIVTKLPAANASVDQADSEGRDAALYAACHAGHLSVVERLLAANAPVDQAETQKGRTPLFAACRARAAPSSSGSCSPRTPRWTRPTQKAVRR